MAVLTRAPATRPIDAETFIMTKRRNIAVFLICLLTAAVVACRSGPEPGRIIVLGLDGMDPRAVDLLMSEGKMPNFARLRQEGAYGRFLSSKPMLSPMLWTTIATGRPPTEHGIGHFVAVDQSSGDSLPVTSEMRQVKALWNILSDHDKKVAVVGWWATWPAEQVNGFVVSDHTCYHFLFREGEAGPEDNAAVTYPPELFGRLKSLVRRPGDLSLEEAAKFIQVNQEEFSQPFDFNEDVSHFKWAFATAESYRKIGLQLWQEERPDLLMVFVEATDSVSHLFGHLFRAGELAGELAEQQKKFGNAVEQMYLYADRLVGEYMEVMDDNTTLVVLSDHGFELGASHDDPSKTRDMRRVSEKYHRLEGILYMYGNRVKRHGRIEQATLLDITPTLLELSGLPQAQDMPGGVLAEALDQYASSPAVASYETSSSPVSAAARDGSVDPQIMERLRSLGYLGDTQSPQGERNLAALHFEAGRYEKAAEVYALLIEKSPEDASLRTSLAGALGAMGRLEEAKEQLEAAIETEPLNVEAYHNRAVIFERQGERDAAVNEYRTALRYNPQYEPSRRALLRLTGSAEVRVPADEAEQRAWELAEEASTLARQGNYPESMKLLDDAERIAPKSVLIQQYRSNVAYLMGDMAAAIKALEIAIELEPDNALFKANLNRLKERAAEAQQ